MTSRKLNYKVANQSKEEIIRWNTIITRNTQLVSLSLTIDEHKTTTKNLLCTPLKKQCIVVMLDDAARHLQGTSSQPAT